MTTDIYTDDEPLPPISPLVRVLDEPLPTVEECRAYLRSLGLDPPEET